MDTAAQTIYLFLLGWLLAQVEIQVEGRHGWAEKLPTWRVERPWLLKLTNGKPLTGYHFYLTTFLFAFFHLPILFTGFSRAVEARVLSLYFLTTIVWDFQWFVWNPFWGPRRFFRDHIWWFPKKVLGFPLEYYLAVGASFAITAVFWKAGLGQWLRLSACLWLASAGSAGLAALKTPDA